MIETESVERKREIKKQTKRDMKSERKRQIVQRERGKERERE